MEVWAERRAAGVNRDFEVSELKTFSPTEVKRELMGFLEMMGSEMKFIVVGREVLGVDEEME